MTELKFTKEEKTAALKFWADQKKAIAGKVSEETMRWVKIMTAPNNFGYGFNELRPAKPGQWDLYKSLIECVKGCSKEEAMLAAGLTAQEIAKEKRERDLIDQGIDPNNPLEVLHNELLDNMNADQLDQHLKNLTALLKD